MQYQTLITHLLIRICGDNPEDDRFHNWSYRAVSIIGTLLRCSHRIQRNGNEVAQFSMDTERSSSLCIPRIQICPLQARTQISYRQAAGSDKLHRVNLHRSSVSLSNLTQDCDFYNDRGFIVVVKNWLSDGAFTAWEFHVSSCAQKDSWLGALRVARSLSELAESSNRSFYRDLTAKLCKAVVVKDRYHLLKKYKKCFLGSEYVKAVQDELECSVEEALRVGNAMISFGLFVHVTQEHELLNSYLFYRFCENNMTHFLSESKEPSPASSGTDLLHQITDLENTSSVSPSPSFSALEALLCKEAEEARDYVQTHVSNSSSTRLPLYAPVPLNIFRYDVTDHRIN